MPAEIVEDVATEELPTDQAEQEEAATAEGEQQAEESAEKGAEQSDEGELVVTLGEEPAPEEDESKAPQWVRDLRKQDREKTRRIRELEAKLQQAQPQPAAVIVGERPTLAACDYDEDKFAAELDKWHERKAKADRQREEQERLQQAQQEAWQRRLGEYRKQAQSLRVPGFEQAEEAIKDTFSTVQQGLLIRACKTPALMVAALGNNERKARELAAINDPIEFVAEIVRLEAQVKTQSRKPATPPERMAPRSSATSGAAIDNQLEKLREEAARTGDMSKVLAYKRQQKVKAA